MVAGRYGFQEIRGQIGGVVDSQRIYHIVDGHHRMAAALEIFRETGDDDPVVMLVKWGWWTEMEKAPLDSRPFPHRSRWGNFRIESAGFELCSLHFPAFQLCAGEAITLSLPNQAHVDQQEIMQYLTGQRRLSGLSMRAKVVLATPASPSFSLRNWFRSPTPFDWLQKNTHLVNSQIREILAKHGLERNLPLNRYAGTPRALLGLEAAYANGPEIILFSTGGLDPRGRQKIFQTVTENLPKCAAIYLAWPYHCQGDERHDVLPGSSSVSVTSTTQSRPFQESVSPTP